MKLHVILSEGDPYDHHLCRDVEDGMIYRIDLMVDGSLDMKPEDLVGKTVKISHMHGYINIGHGVELVEDDND